jgi:hypothetical protein
MDVLNATSKASNPRLRNKEDPSQKLKTRHHQVQSTDAVKTDPATETGLALLNLSLSLHSNPIGEQRRNDEAL